MISMRLYTLTMPSVLLIGICFLGCQPSGEPEADSVHRHDVPSHLPKSLWDLSRQMRSRVRILEREDSNASARYELRDLISWTPEFAADTSMTEKRWTPIYQLSETIRLSIEDDPADWGTSRRDQVIRLCQISEDAWLSLDAADRTDRYQGHEHGHDHEHEHEHADGHSHDHGETHRHDHDVEHSHDHDDGHSHDHDDGHSHDHGGEHDHEHDDDQHGHSHDHDHEDHGIDEVAE